MALRNVSVAQFPLSVRHLPARGARAPSYVGPTSTFTNDGPPRAPGVTIAPLELNKAVGNKGFGANAPATSSCFYTSFFKDNLATDYPQGELLFIIREVAVTAAGTRQLLENIRAKMHRPIKVAGLAELIEYLGPGGKYAQKGTFFQTHALDFLGVFVHNREVDVGIHRPAAAAAKFGTYNHTGSSHILPYFAGEYIPAGMHLYLFALQDTYTGPPGAAPANALLEERILFYPFTSICSNMVQAEKEFFESLQPTRRREEFMLPQEDPAAHIAFNGQRIAAQTNLTTAIAARDAGIPVRDAAIHQADGSLLAKQNAYGLLVAEIRSMHPNPPDQDDLINLADAVFAADTSHRDGVKNASRQTGQRLVLLNQAKQDVTDNVTLAVPVGGDAAVFTAAFNLIMQTWLDAAAVYIDDDIQRLAAIAVFYALEGGVLLETRNLAAAPPEVSYTAIEIGKRTRVGVHFGLVAHSFISRSNATCANTTIDVPKGRLQCLHPNMSTQRLDRPFHLSVLLAKSVEQYTIVGPLPQALHVGTTAIHAAGAAALLSWRAFCGVWKARYERNHAVIQPGNYVRPRYAHPTRGGAAVFNAHPLHSMPGQMITGMREHGHTHGHKRPEASLLADVSPPPVAHNLDHDDNISLNDAATIHGQHQHAPVHTGVRTGILHGGVHIPVEDIHEAAGDVRNPPPPADDEAFLAYLNDQPEQADESASSSSKKKPKRPKVTHTDAGQAGPAS